MDLLFLKSLLTTALLFDVFGLFKPARSGQGPYSGEWYGNCGLERKLSRAIRSRVQGSRCSAEIQYSHPLKHILASASMFGMEIKSREMQSA
jgi:hypothetical protein